MQEEKIITGTDTYTATQNCYIRVFLHAYGTAGGQVVVNGVSILGLQGITSATTPVQMIDTIPVRKGDAVKIIGNGSYASKYTVYGMR